MDREEEAAGVGGLAREQPHAPSFVLVSLKPEASAEQLAAWRDAGAGMCETSDEVLSSSAGSRIGSGPDCQDAARVTDFADMPTFRRCIGSDGYMVHVEDHAHHMTARLAAIRHEM